MKTKEIKLIFLSLLKQKQKNKKIIILSGLRTPTRIHYPEAFTLLFLCWIIQGTSNALCLQCQHYPIDVNRLHVFQMYSRALNNITFYIKNVLHQPIKSMVFVANDGKWNPCLVTEEVWPSFSIIGLCQL